MKSIEYMEHKAVAFIRKTPDMPCLHGTHNGYVAVPPTNKYHGKHYFDIKDIKYTVISHLQSLLFLGKSRLAVTVKLTPNISVKDTLYWRMCGLSQRTQNRR